MSTPHSTLHRKPKPDWRRPAQAHDPYRGDRSRQTAASAAGARISQIGGEHLSGGGFDRELQAVRIARLFSQSAVVLGGLRGLDEHRDGNRTLLNRNRQRPVPRSRRPSGLAHGSRRHQPRRCRDIPARGLVGDRSLPAWKKSPTPFTPVVSALQRPQPPGLPLQTSWRRRTFLSAELAAGAWKSTVTAWKMPCRDWRPD